MSRKSKNGLLVLKKYPEFRKLFLARVISRLGDSLDSIAFMWIVYELSGSTVLMGTFMMFNFLPNVILGLFAGVLVEGWKKKNVMLVGDFGRFAAVCLAAFLYLTGHLQVWHLFLLTLINSTFETFVVPARSAVIPRLVTEKDDLLPSGAFTASASALAEIVGLSLAGIVIGFAGPGVAILVDGGTFLFSGFLILGTKIPLLEREKLSEAMQFGGFVSDLKEGLKTAAGNNFIRFSILLGVMINLFISPFSVIAPVYTSEVLKAGAEVYSLLSVFIAVGLMGGSFFVGILGKKLGYSSYILGGVAAMAGGFLILGGTSLLLPALAGALLLGIGAAFLSASVNAMVMENCSQELLGRVSSVMNSSMMAATPLSTALAGVLAVHIAIPVFMSGIGICVALVGLILYRLSFRGAKMVVER